MRARGEFELERLDEGVVDKSSPPKQAWSARLHRGEVRYVLPSSPTANRLAMIGGRGLSTASPLHHDGMVS